MTAIATNPPRFLKPLLLVLTLVFVGLFAAGTVVAEGPDKAQGEKATERVRVLRAMKIAEHFDLEEDTEKRLLEVLDTYDEKLIQGHRSLHKERRSLRRAMRDEETSDAEIERRRKSIIKASRALEDLRYERLEKASALLGPRDRVKLMVFLPKFEKKVRKVVREARGKKGRKNKRKRRGPR